MKNEKGQTSVEYVLLIAVMITIAVTFFGKLNEYIITNPDSVLNRYLGGFQQVLGSPDGNSGVSGSYKRFRLPR
jgi:hypothetical protein